MTAATAQPTKTSLPHGPWLGLESYREQDADRFFGREKETEELLRMIRRDVLTIVFGPSGIGKTSLLRAGVFGRLYQEDQFPVYIRPTYQSSAAPVADQALECIRQTLKQSGIEQEPDPDAGPTLWEYLHSTTFWSSNNRVLTPVLFLDQFEEVFTVGGGLPITPAFLKDLADIVENYRPEAVTSRLESARRKIPAGYGRQPYKVVISLREDFVHRLDALRKSMPSIMQNRYPLAQLNGRQALDAVAKPGQGIVTPAVAEEIVRFAAAGSKGAEAEGVKELEDLRVDPALLSVVCQELYTRAVAGGTSEIASGAVQDAGIDILDDFYERSFIGLPPAARIFVEDRLLTASGFRNTAPVEEAVAAGLSRSVIDDLVARRLIRVEQRLGIPHLELTHDLLARVVQANRKSRQERERRLAAEKQREEQARRLRRTRLILFVMAAMAVLSLVFAGAAYYAWGKADASAAAARKAERRAQEAEYMAQCLRAIDYAENELRTAQDQRDTVGIAAAQKQLADLRKGLDAVRSGKWKPPSAAPIAGSAPAATAVLNASAAGSRADTILTTSDIVPSKFIDGYNSVFKPPLSGDTAAAVSDMIRLINQDRTISDLRFPAYILATIRFESGGSWRTDSEKGTPELALSRYGPATPLGKRLGNTEPEDAYRYRGRGYLFLVGKGNYARFGKLMDMGDQLVSDPDLMLRRDVAFRMAAQGMIKGWFNGRKLSDFIAGEGVDYVNARRVVGGLDHALEIFQAATKLEQILGGSLQPAGTAGR